MHRAGPHLLVHAVRAQACVPPLGEPLQPADLGLLHLVRPLDGLVGENLGHGGVDAAPGERGGDFGLLERRVREVGIGGQVVERALGAL